MRLFADKGKRKAWRIPAFILLVLAFMLGACAIHVSDSYRADEDAIRAFPSMSAVTIGTLPDGALVFMPESPRQGVIFYPGGKVDYTAYQPLMAACAEQGILCVLVEMPFNLAVLDVNAADGIREQFPGIQDWYIGGHSLGGSMAAAYLARHAEDYRGLILLGSYTTADLSAAGIDVLSIYGSEDTVLSREKYDACRRNLPPDWAEVVIDGGCHAYFGMYGEQAGDGTPAITQEEQIRQTVEAIVHWMQ